MGCLCLVPPSPRPETPARGDPRQPGRQRFFPRRRGVVVTIAALDRGQGRPPALSQRLRQRSATLLPLGAGDAAALRVRHDRGRGLRAGGHGARPAHPRHQPRPAPVGPGRRRVQPGPVARARHGQLRGRRPSNYANMTFLHGPRSCIGLTFARSEAALPHGCYGRRFQYGVGGSKQGARLRAADYYLAEGRLEGADDTTVPLVGSLAFIALRGQEGGGRSYSILVCSVREGSDKRIFFLHA